ncbi:MAG: HlyD family type I secretion periplasmic adaptor subunit [Azovibrio sp.]|uniref:HlyD family type I secretion periplasmic adaptor subunit n=1 Tax=Azovibrio sp. TaxID=1872673 RepID=UPI003C77A68F
MAIRDLFGFLVPRHPDLEATQKEGQENLPMDTRHPARVGLWVLGVGFGGFLLWAALAPLDEGVPTQGMVTIDTKRKAVQHLSGGIIKAVHVKEGQFVKAGAPLLEIDEAATQANFESVRQRYLTLRAMEGRLLAEQSGAEKISFHPDLMEARTDPRVEAALVNQESLFLARRGALQAELQSIDESILGNEAAIRGYQGMLEGRKAQQGFIQEEMTGLRDLVSEGYAPRNNLLALERTAAETTGSIADLIGNIERSRRAISELKQRKIQRQQEYRKEVDGQLAEVRSQVQAEADKFVAVRDELARTILRAPVDGQVVGLVAQTVGGVITPGQKVMDIVPKDEALVLETKVPPHLIDRVQPGRTTNVRFSAFSHSPQLVVPGKVDSISSDLLTEPQTGVSYYLARVSITPEGMKILGDRQMQAGMPAEVIIITGERSMLTYLLRPLLSRIAVSMKEE